MAKISFSGLMITCIYDIWQMKLPFYPPLLCLLILLSSGPAGSQGYFKLLEKPGKTYNKKIGRFRNGDVLIGDSTLDGQNSTENRGIFITRIDPCGNVVWAKSYGWKENYMEFKDLLISQHDEVFLYGSAYEGFNELIFLLKIDDKGQVKRFGLFRSGTVDHFTYSIDLRNNRLMAYGLLLDWDSQKQGFVALFDTESLDYQWGVLFEPFESIGDAKITADGGFICRSGPYLVKLNQQGGLHWAIAPESGLNFYPSAGPFEVPGGYILEYYQDQAAFFYKIDGNGSLVWKSPKFTATRHAAMLSPMPDGNLLAMYSRPGLVKNEPCRMLLSSEGAILEQQTPDIALDFNIGLLDQSISPDGSVNIVGNADEFALEPGKPAGFLLQYSLDAPEGDCFGWQSFEDQIKNDQATDFEYFMPNFLNASMTRADGEITEGSLDYRYLEFCDLYAVDTIGLDTLLLCGEHWAVSLPGAGFKWKDGVRDNPRLLDNPGVYLASNNDCLNPVIYKYAVERQPCTCTVYLPTAFSPDADGLNDRLGVFSNCTLQELEMTVYDRWGSQVFASRGPETVWTGKVKDKPAPEGVYVVMARYRLLDDTGLIQEGELAQGVLLVR